MFVFPPLGLLVGFAGIIQQNWAGVKEFFSTVWETFTLATKVAFEFVQFVALSGLVAIQNAWAGVTGFFAAVWGGIREMFVNTPLAPIFDWMVDGITAVVHASIQFL